MSENVQAAPTAAEIIRLSFNNEEAHQVALHAWMTGGEFTQQHLNRANNYYRAALILVGGAVSTGLGALCTETLFRQPAIAGSLAVAAAGLALSAVGCHVKSTKEILVARSDAEVDGLPLSEDS